MTWKIKTLIVFLDQECRYGMLWDHIGVSDTVNGEGMKTNMRTLAIIMKVSPARRQGTRFHCKAKTPMAGRADAKLEGSNVERRSPAKCKTSAH